MAAARKLAKQKRQARDIDEIVRNSIVARRQVIRGVALVGQCEHATSGAYLLRRAIAGRAAVLAQLADVEVSALPGGRSTVRYLEQAQNASLAADQAFLGWANNSGYNCFGRSTAYQDESYQAGVATSAEAQADKRRFVKAWARIAKVTGLKQFTTSEI